MTTAWHDWHDKPIPCSSPDDRHLEQQLGWAENTLPVLRHAFALNLPRQVGWRIPASRAFVDAARYYKRGVAVRGKPHLFSVPHTQLHSVEQLSDLHDYLADRYVVCDRQVASLHKISSTALTIVAEEQNKNLTTVAEILQQWRAQGSPSQWTIVGGGITLDVAAFAAALCRAQIVLVPTTLLAMLDAAHGGKNGVNFLPWGKNQLGTFYFAERVIMCPTWLQTLAPPELQAGSWEGVKHALLAGDNKLLQAWCQCQAGQALTWQLLQKTAHIKIAIVQRDPYEHGERKILNFGHTLAHALEALAQENNTQLRHGHAVGIGILYAILISQALGKIKKITQLTTLSNSKAMLTHKALAKALGYDMLNDPQLWSRLMHYIKQDKKRRGNKVWILLQDNQPLPRVCPTPYTVDDRVLHKTWQQLLRLLSVTLAF